MHDLTRPEGPTGRDFDLTRRAAGGLLFAGYALGAGPLRADPIHTDETGLIAKMVQVPAPDGVNLPAYLAFPEHARKAPVIVVVCEVFGLHEYIRDVCRRLAKAGYVAIAPDLFARAGDPSGLTDFNEIRKIVSTATNAQVMGDIKALLDWLATNPDVGQSRGMLGGLDHFADMRRVGITGFCWGGAEVWMAVATDPRFKAGVAWYGRLAHPKPDEFGGGEARQWPIDLAGSLHGPMLGLYAGKDQGITAASIDEMRGALTSAGDTRSEIVVYPEASHGFHADYRANTYDQPAAEDGWKRLLAWFDTYVKHG
jgi:carboxymethylenebutenolidase